MKTWTKVCTIYLFLLTFIIFTSSLAILFLVKVPEYGSPGKTINGIHWIKNVGFTKVLKLFGPVMHKNISYMFDPKFTYTYVPGTDDSAKMINNQEGATFFVSGLYLFILAFPVFLLISVLVLYNMMKFTLYPTKQVFIDEKARLKKLYKQTKSEFKEKIKHATTKQEIIDLQNEKNTEILKVKKLILENKNQIEMDYKLKRKHIIKVKK